MNSTMNQSRCGHFSWNPVNPDDHAIPILLIKSNNVHVKLVVLIEEALVEESHIGLDDGHLHAVADEFEAEGLGQAVDGVFRPGIHGESRFGIVALSRRTAHVNYPP